MSMVQLDDGSWVRQGLPRKAVAEMIASADPTRYVVVSPATFRLIQERCGSTEGYVENKLLDPDAK